MVQPFVTLISLMIPGQMAILLAMLPFIGTPWWKRLRLVQCSGSHKAVSKNLVSKCSSGFRQSVGKGASKFWRRVENERVRHRRWKLLVCPLSSLHIERPWIAGWFCGSSRGRPTDGVWNRLWLRLYVCSIYSRIFITWYLPHLHRRTFQEVFSRCGSSQATQTGTSDIIKLAKFIGLGPGMSQAMSRSCRPSGRSWSA